MTVIEIKPHRNGWKVFEAPGVEPVLKKDQAINYAENRASFREEPAAVENEFKGAWPLRRGFLVTLSDDLPILLTTGDADVPHEVGEQPFPPIIQRHLLRFVEVEQLGPILY